MTPKAKQKVIIVSSFILYLIHMLDHTRTVPHVKKLKKRLLDVTIKQGTLVEATLSNNAWAKVVDEYEKANLRIAIATVIETLAFTFEKDMVAMYGDSILDDVCSFVERESIGDISKYSKDSYIASDALSDAVRDIVFKG